MKKYWAAGSYGLLTLLVALSIAWVGLKHVDFLYPIWHDHGGIAEGIEKYGPKNRYKPGFADTSRAQRFKAFHEINLAVHNHGEGLSHITYESPSSYGPKPLLREPEVVHLQDVANLIDFFRWVVMIVLLLWVAVSLAQFKGALKLYPLKLQAIGPVAALGMLGLVMLIFGAEETFNTLHIWIFPDDHQWFFYYQESLMSTMMLAPTLFGWIAAAWVVSACLVGGLLSWGKWYWLRGRK